MPRVDIKQDEDNDDNHEQAAEGNEEWGGGVWGMANENGNAVMNRNISSQLKCNQGLRIQCT